PICGQEVHHRMHGGSRDRGSGRGRGPAAEEIDHQHGDAAQEKYKRGGDRAEVVDADAGHAHLLPNSWSQSRTAGSIRSVNQVEPRPITTISAISGMK